MSERPGHPLLGVALIIGAGLAFATMDTTIRHLSVSATLPVLLLLCARYGVQAAMMAVWLPLRSGISFRSEHPRFQLARGLLLLGSSALGFLGLAHMPVAEFTSIALLTPVLVTLLSAWLLHEKVAPARWALVIGAGIGALIVVRPGSGLFGGWVVLYPLANACCYASFQVLTARLSGLENPLTTHFWTGFVGTAVVVPATLAFHGGELLALLQALPWSVWALLLLVGTLGSSGHLMLIYSFGLASPAALMPFMYLQIGSAALLGYLVFAHLPDGWAWAGMAVIAACGAASAWLNVRAAAFRRMSAVEADTVAE